MVEGVALRWVQGWVRHAQDLVQYISHSTELVKLHGEAALQVRDHHTNISVDWLQRLQLQLALLGGRVGHMSIHVHMYKITAILNHKHMMQVHNSMQ